MAEYDIEENADSYVLTPTDAMTGDRSRRMQLYYQLIQSIAGAKKIDIIEIQRRYQTDNVNIDFFLLCSTIVIPAEPFLPVKVCK